MPISRSQTAQWRGIDGDSNHLDPSTLNDPDQDHDDRNHQKDVNESAHGVGRHEP